MNSPLTITEVLGRAEQGMTKPFLCVAEFAEYYAKERAREFGGIGIDPLMAIG